MPFFADFAMVGVAVGAADGLVVEAVDGLAVGEADGLAVGEADGLAVAASQLAGRLENPKQILALLQQLFKSDDIKVCTFSPRLLHACCALHEPMIFPTPPE